MTENQYHHFEDQVAAARTEFMKLWAEQASYLAVKMDDIQIFWAQQAAWRIFLASKVRKPFDRVK